MGSTMGCGHVRDVKHSLKEVFKVREVCIITYMV